MVEWLGMEGSTKQEWLFKAQLNEVYELTRKVWVS